MRLTPRPPLRARDERGAVAVVFAGASTMLLVVTAMVLDFGLVRLDRTTMKSAADSAVMAGLRAADGKTGDVYTYRGVCGALAFLKANEPDLAALPADVCAAPDETVTCDPANPAAGAATYDATVSSGGARYRVVIKSPVQVDEGDFPQDSYASQVTDQSTAGGCDQLGVIVSLARRPGLGSVATTSDLVSRVRSIGRVTIGGGNDELAPALIVLERTACNALTIGSAGTTTYVRVKGFGNRPGTIHLDSDASGSGCGSGSNQQLVQGKQNDGIVAYGAPVGGASGLITSYATHVNQSANRIYDSVNHVYGTPTLDSLSAVTTRNPVAARDLVGRRLVDIRYRAAVRTAITQTASVWALNPASPAGWVRAGCSPSAAQLATTTKLYIDCPGNSGITITGTVQASEIFFNGFVKGGDLAMPNATRVYVNNRDGSGGTVNANGISLSNGNGFCIRAASCTAADACPSLPTGARARLFVRQGAVNASGGLLRMCNTTAFLLGGDAASGCVPDSDGTAPTSAPCTTSPSAGSSTVDLSGGASVDWTAPNQTSGSATPTMWGDFEDLALWSESAAQYRMIGGGSMNLVGVLFTPNASPFQVGGGGDQVLTNAQFVTRAFAVNGGGRLTMTTDPRNAVSLPALSGFTLVR